MLNNTLYLLMLIMHFYIIESRLIKIIQVLIRVSTHKMSKFPKSQIWEDKVMALGLNSAFIG